MNGTIRFILVRRECPFCLKAIKAVLFLNRHLDDDARIEIIDNYEWEEFGFRAHPFIDNRLNPKTFDGYPYIYIDGIEVEPSEIENLKIIIGRIVEEDIHTPFNVGEILIP